jgi:hypothetical protein
MPKPANESDQSNRIPGGSRRQSSEPTDSGLDADTMQWATVIQTKLLYIRGHSNFHAISVFGVIQIQSLSNNVSIRKISPRQRFRNNDHARSIRVVFAREMATLNNRIPHYLQ